MTHFLLRDDDVNVTTDMRRFERFYAPLLEAGHSIACSVIPEVALDTLAPDGVRERFLSQGSPIAETLVPFRYDDETAVYLRRNESQLEVLQHGHSHRRLCGGTEFGSLAYEQASSLLERGRSVLERALGRPLDGFVAPWDTLSAGSVRAVLERYPLLSTGWVDHKLLPIAWWPGHLLERITRSDVLRNGHAMVLRHRGGPLTPELDPAAVPEVLERISRRSEVCVVLLHHWMFWDGERPHPVITALAKALRGRRVTRVQELFQ